jgi:hypothetical protein
MPSTTIAAGPISRWKTLAINSDRDEVREQVRRALRSRMIRVKPWPGDPERVRILPVPDDMQQSGQ